MLQTKSVHYPSGFPMPQTPPVFICSSPGPDPYESNDNLYEELDQPDNSQSDNMSHNDSHITLAAPQSHADRMSDHLNSSAVTAMTEEISNNNETTTASNVLVAAETVPLPAALGINENEVERLNRINAQMSNTAFSIATIFRDRHNNNNLRQQQQRRPNNSMTTATIAMTTPRANANYYAPSHTLNGANVGNSNRVNSSSDGNCQFLTNPRACWGAAHYEPIVSSVYNSQCLNSYTNHHHNHNGELNEPHQQQQFATMRNFNSLRSPHHINQNTINSSKNIWSWFRRVRT